jgi:hypothetical protein
LKRQVSSARRFFIWYNKVSYLLAQNARVEKANDEVGFVRTGFGELVLDLPSKQSAPRDHNYAIADQTHEVMPSEFHFVE